MTQLAFPFGVPLEFGRARWGARKDFILSLVRNDPVIVETDSAAKALQNCAAQIGLRAGRCKVERGRPETWFWRCS